MAHNYAKFLFYLFAHFSDFIFSLLNLKKIKAKIR
jgi:hypothetical protein